MIPTIYGEKVVMRLLDKTNLKTDLMDLGFDRASLTEITHAIQQPHGMILLTGPTGSGKTTTLYSALMYINRPDINIMTVEDPVEYDLAGINQVKARPEIGLDFAAALRSFVRQDPDVILVGEIRDRETAAIALEAGLTGHLVLSTVHAGTAPQVFARLLEMDVEPFVLTTAVRGVLAQRLLRRSCTECTAAGCDTCAGTGYRGRVVAAEWAGMDDALRRAVLARGDGEELRAALVDDERVTLRESAQELVRQGLTTDEEVRRVLGRA